MIVYNIGLICELLFLLVYKVLQSLQVEEFIIPIMLESKIGKMTFFNFYTKARHKAIIIRRHKVNLFEKVIPQIKLILPMDQCKFIVISSGSTKYDTFL